MLRVAATSQATSQAATTNKVADKIKRAAPWFDPAVRLFEKRKGINPTKESSYTREKEEKLGHRDLKPPKDAKGGVGGAVKLANPLSSQAASSDS